MKGEQIKQVLERKTKKISKLCEQLSPAFDEETIHKFRVEVKRLRSLLRLVNANKEQPALKLPKKFKQLYDIAGSIRDAQLEIKKIGDWHITLPTYSQHLSQSIQIKKNEWDNLYNKKVTNKLRKRLTNHDLQHLRPEILTSFFNHHLKKIYSLYKNSPDNEDIHTIRKQVKDLLYNSKFAEEEWQKGFNELQSFPLKTLDTLSDIIGSYNDERLLLEHLEHFSVPAGHQKEKEKFAKLFHEEIKMQSKKKTKLLSAIKRLTGTKS